MIRKVSIDSSRTYADSANRPHYLVPPAEIAKWRIQTIKVGEMLPRDHHHSHRLVELDDLPKRQRRPARAVQARFQSGAVDETVHGGVRMGANGTAGFIQRGRRRSHRTLQS